MSEAIVGLSSKRTLPKWRGDSYRHGESPARLTVTPVILFGDTFNTYFDSENLHAARKVLAAGGFTGLSPLPEGSSRPPCCGRTYLASGLVDEARAEARRLIAAYLPLVRPGRKIVGLEPSCLLTLRDELTAMKLGPEADEIAAAAMMFEEFVVEHADRFQFTALDRNVLLHGHCHQKAHNVMGSVTGALKLVPGLKVETVESSCCGMAGAFGYQAETYEVSQGHGRAVIVAVGARGRIGYTDRGGRHLVPAPDCRWRPPRGHSRGPRAGDGHCRQHGRNPPMNMTMDEAIVRRSLHDELVERLQRLIIEGELTPGEKVPEKELCERYNVSRTPMREALKVLASEGLVTLTPNRGSSVTAVTVEDLEEVFPVMGALEALSGELACRKDHRCGNSRHWQNPPRHDRALQGAAPAGLFRRQ